MKSIEEIKATPRIYNTEYVVLDGIAVFSGFIELYDSGSASFVCSVGETHNHVSVSPVKESKIPTWKDMCQVKKAFWRDDEEAVQIHPRESDYVHSVGRLENVLHLWSPKDGD